MRMAYIVAGILIGVGWCYAQRTSETAEWLFADPQEIVKTATRTEKAHRRVVHHRARADPQGD
jgi:hypothetical protein